MMMVVSVVHFEMFTGRLTILFYLVQIDVL